jgi:hypothetical protein
MVNISEMARSTTQLMVNISEMARLNEIHTCN